MFTPLFQPRRWAAAAAATLAIGLVVGCESHETARNPKAVAPPPTFTGPAFLHGSIGSLATLRGANAMFVGGYGVVANLPGTGSAEVPAFLRQRMLNEARLMGWGNANIGGVAEAVSPATFLASPNTAVVKVEGLIPPGATKGTRFDVLVSALPQTQTTSLEDGDLYTTSLGVGGTIPAIRFAREQARAAGPTYLNPFDDASDKKKFELRQQVVVLSGGRVTNDRRMELLLNQPSWHRSRLIADRINERFPKAPIDRDDTAVAKTDLVVELHVPARFASDPRLLLQLISHLYLQRSPGFEPEQAQRLGELVTAQPRYAADVALAWRALGKTAVPVIREYFSAPAIAVRLAALDAASGLGDESAAQVLADLAEHEDTDVRRRVAMILLNLPRNLVGSQTLQRLVSDEQTPVRIAAYETLAAIGDPFVQRTPMNDRSGQLKFILDLVPSDRPLIYVSQARLPRIVVFGLNTGFKTPLNAAVWDGRLRLRGQSPDQPVTVFFQHRGQIEGAVQTIAPTVANLTFLLAHAPSAENPSDGLALTYSSAVSALFALARQDCLEAPIELEPNPLATAVVELRDQPEEGDVRPDTAPAADAGPPPGQTPVQP